MTIAGSRVDGLAETYSMLDRIPVEAEHQFADLLGRVGRSVLLAQKADVAKKTGALEQGLTMQLLTEELRVRVGLLNSKRGRSNLFYGRVIELGRREQTVLVTRRLKRRVTGNGRNGTSRKVTYEGKPYKMKVKAMGKRPFVHVDRPELRMEQQLAAFWSQVVPKAGGAA